MQKSHPPTGFETVRKKVILPKDILGSEMETGRVEILRPPGQAG